MKRAHTNPGVAYQKALDDLDTAERKMRRAFKAWDRARQRLAREGKKLDRLALLDP